MPATEHSGPAQARGKVYIVGAGPGDPKLLTLRGLERIREADLVIYDRLVSEEILKLVPSRAAKVHAGMDARHHHRLTQAEINELMVSEARKGKSIVRLKGGDPFIFGRGGEEAEYLMKNSVGFEIVPGVTSATAVPAYAGIPLTHRRLSSSFAIVTGHEDPSKQRRRVRWSQLASSVDTIVILMGASTFKKISRELIRSGMARDTPVAIIEWGTTERQRTLSTTLGEASQAGTGTTPRPPCVIVVGKVAEFANRLA